MKNTICLNMIVKNETKNIKRLFKSLYEVIDYYVIHDTGSTDGTQELIKEVMDSYGISGEIIEEEWVNFGVNRQKALESVLNSKYKSDYLLWIDADEELVYKNKDFFNNLTKDCYNIKRKYGTIDYYNPHLIRVNNNNNIGWIWKGPVHNYLSNSISYTRVNVDINDVHIISHPHAGAKSHGVTNEEKYLRDAKLLLDHLKENPNDPRSLFYLAQSYRDAENWKEESIKWYKKRLEVEGWIQEKYISCYNIGNLLRKLGKTEEAFYYYLLSYEFDSSRHECFYEMIKHYRMNGKKKLAYSLYKQLKPINKNSGKLFLVYSVHDWKLDYEVTIIAYYSQAYQEGINAFKRLFKCKTIKTNLIASIIKNFNYYQKFIKEEDRVEIENLKKNFKEFYIKKNLKTPITTNIKTPPEISLEVENHLKEQKNNDKEEKQGLKLTVTEKIN